MNDPKVAIAFVGVVGASAAFAIWWLRGDGGLAPEPSRIESVSSAGLRHHDSIAATRLIHTWFRDTGHYCHWHQENRLTSPAWWLAEYYGRVQERHPTSAQIAQLEALITTIEHELDAADAAVEVELTPAVIDKMVRNEFESIGSKADQHHGSDAVPSRTSREGWPYTSLPYGYHAGVGGLLVREADIAEIRVGERPSLDAALDTKATLHHDAPKRIRQLIESFK